jgi:hypothetical protein
MARASETKYVNDARTLVGYGDTKDLALNDLLEKLKAHGSEIRCACSNEGEVCRPLLLSPPASSSASIGERVLARSVGSACGALAFWNSSAPLLSNPTIEITVRTATEHS